MGTLRGCSESPLLVHGEEGCYAAVMAAYTALELAEELELEPAEAATGGVNKPPSMLTQSSPLEEAAASAAPSCALPGSCWHEALTDKLICREVSGERFILKSIAQEWMCVS